MGSTAESSKVGGVARIDINAFKAHFGRFNQ